jgi:hypothetical protein
MKYSSNIAQILAKRNLKLIENGAQFYELNGEGFLLI